MPVFTRRQLLNGGRYAAAAALPALPLADIPGEPLGAWDCDPSRHRLCLSAWRSYRRRTERKMVGRGRGLHRMRLKDRSRRLGGKTLAPRLSPRCANWRVMASGAYMGDVPRRCGVSGDCVAKMDSISTMAFLDNAEYSPRPHLPSGSLRNSTVARSAPCQA